MKKIVISFFVGLMVAMAISPILIFCQALSLNVQNTADIPQGITSAGDIWFPARFVTDQGCHVAVPEGIKDMRDLGGRKTIITPNDQLIWYQSTARLGPPKPLGVGDWHIVASDNTLVAWSKEGRVLFFQDTAVVSTWLLPADIIAVMSDNTTSLQDDTFLVVHEMSRMAESITASTVQTGITIDFYVDQNAVLQRDGTLSGAYIDTVGGGGYAMFFASGSNLVQLEKFSEPTLSSSFGGLTVYMTQSAIPMVVCDSNHYTTIYIKDGQCNVTSIIKQFGPNSGTLVLLKEQNTIVFGSDSTSQWQFPGQSQIAIFQGIGTIHLNGTTAIDPAEQAQPLAYPNPFLDRLVISSGSTIFDNLGRVVYQDANSDLAETVIPTAHWAKGMYTIVGPQGSQKILKQ